MRKIICFINCLFILCGCAGCNTAGIRPEEGKRKSFVSVSFELNEKELVGKDKQQVKEIFGEPARVLERIDNGITNEMWIFYPEETKTFIAIIVSFDGDKVRQASYESVM